LKADAEEEDADERPAGLTLPGHGISTTTAMLWEIVLTTGAGERDPGDGFGRHCRCPAVYALRR
jgi:hypothetical protein